MQHDFLERFPQADLDKNVRGDVIKEGYEDIVTMQQDMSVDQIAPLRVASQLQGWKR